MPAPGDWTGRLMPESEILAAVGRFEGDPPAMLRQSVRTAERAFRLLDECDDVLDHASEEALAVVLRLGPALDAENAEAVPAMLAELRGIATTVSLSEPKRQLVNQLLGLDRPAAPDVGDRRPPTMPALPRVPSVYDGQAPDTDDLLAMSEAHADFVPKLREVHAERIRLVSSHLVGLLTHEAGTGFADHTSTANAFAEAERAYLVWRQCLAERARDLAESDRL